MAKRTSTWVKDINEMHEKFGVHEWLAFKQFDQEYEVLRQFLAFRINFLEEELNETREAFINKDAEEVIDGLIDICVIAIGTLDILGVDADHAWRQVHAANMAKEPGVKASRPNTFGLPDLIKPANWQGPDHRGNYGDTADFL